MAALGLPAPFNHHFLLVQSVLRTKVKFPILWGRGGVAWLRGLDLLHGWWYRDAGRGEDSATGALGFASQQESPDYLWMQLA